jgi:hypothetical protein
MMRDEIEMFKGQTVEIMANGLLYKGILIGASDETISLQTTMQWLEIPMEQITSLRGSNG